MHPVGTWGGVPVYDGSTVEVVLTEDFEAVLIGVGPADGPPVAYVTLCPTEGVRGIVAELFEAAEPLRERHAGRCVS